jgi:hypothetical protein
MAILHIGHIKAALKKRFDGLIDLSDVPNAKGDDVENFFLTRSLAAFVIAELANVDDKIAAKAIVDGSKDNGLDAFYFDATDRVCYLVQSKWVHNGKGSIEVGEVHKFLQGVTDLLGSKLDSFDKLRQKKADIDAALTDSSARFVLVTDIVAAKKQATDAESHLAEALRRAAEATAELNRLKSPRQLSSDQVNILVTNLSPYAPTAFWVIIETNDYDRGSEPMVFGQQLTSILEAAKWKHLRMGEDIILPLYNPISQRGVTIASSPNLLSTASVLSNELNRFLIRNTIRTFGESEVLRKNFKGDLIVLIVGMQ